MAHWNRALRELGRDPLGELDRMQQRMQDLFGRTVARWPGASHAFPAVNVWADDDRVVVTAEVPGVARDDLGVSLEGNVLTLKGSRKPEALGEGGAARRLERGHGEFARSVELPYAVAGDEVTADYTDGVLTVKLPRSPETKARRIEIGA